MNTTLKQTRRPDVTFYKNGRIDICCRVAKLLNLAEGDVIDIATDRGEYLLFVRHRAENAIGRHKAMVYASNRRRRFTNSFRTFSRNLTDAIRGASQASEEDDVLRLPAGDAVEIDGIGTAVPIITRTPL